MFELGAIVGKRESGWKGNSSVGNFVMGVCRVGQVPVRVERGV